MLQVFDSWAGELSPTDFRIYSLPYLKRIASEVKTRLGRNRQVPMTVFAKGAHYALEELATLDYDVIGLDWTMDPVLARQRVGPNVVLQGNLDPGVLYGTEDVIRQKTRDMVKAFGGGKGKWVANLGHGIQPEVDPEALRVFLDEIHKASSAANEFEN